MAKKYTFSVKLTVVEERTFEIEATDDQHAADIAITVQTAEDLRISAMRENNEFYVPLGVKSQGRPHPPKSNATVTRSS